MGEMIMSIFGFNMMSGFLEGILSSFVIYYLLYTDLIFDVDNWNTLKIDFFPWYINSHFSWKLILLSK